MAGVEVQYAIEVLEGIAATIEQGVYNLISKTPVNPLVLDQTAIGLLEQAAGTALEPVINNAGETIGYVAKGVAQAGNGAATEVSTYVNVLTKETIVDAEMIARAPVDIATGETAAIAAGETVTEVAAGSTGAGLLATSIPIAGAAIAPVLGIGAGYALYNIAPTFWDSVANRLMDAGQLINGKVKAIFGTDKKTSFSKETIEIFKDAFLDAGFFNQDIYFPDISEDITFTYSSATYTMSKEDYNIANKYIKSPVAVTNEGMRVTNSIELTVDSVEYSISPQDFVTCCILQENPERCTIAYSTDVTNLRSWLLPSYQASILFKDSAEELITTASGYIIHKVVVGSETKYILDFVLEYLKGDLTYEYYKNLANTQNINPIRVAVLAWFFMVGMPNPNIQEGATLPGDEPFEDTYPDWHPNNNIQGEDYYPASMPTDQNTQAPSQTGDNDKDEQEDIIADILFNPDPIPTPSPQPDPDPQPDPEPETDTDTPTPVPDPMDPNPEPDPSDPSPTLPIISGIHATKMCTIYNPTDGEVDDLGAFLWVDNVIEQIRLIFQDPMDGIISLHKIYAPPVTGSRKDIILGYIDSGVDALEVTNQFTTVNCGSISVGRKFNNATDYPPYTQAHIYLPFIGIEEIDVAEIMGGSVRVQYRVDAYTGTCVAQVFVTRSPDMGTEQMLYTFSGNASQTIPLTSANFTGLVSSLVSIAGGAATAGAGGALLAAARGMTTHMASVSHSGSISANAGIMGPRVPYIILTRPQAYDANGYNSIYGYPANTTRYLSNCSGYVRVKDVLYRGDGTEEEKAEIVSLLKNGVIV